jgi:lipopolysaccharide cholinephosphotransferase
VNPKLSDFAGRDPIPLESVKRIELDILEVFDAFCKAHSLPYFLLYGTLIGAVRHKGFIPWDDDIDVGMLRPDYERFAALFPKLHAGPYAIASGATNPSYPLNFLKVHDPRTVTFEPGRRYSYSGVFIDVFPLDAVPADLKKRQRIARLMEVLKKVKAEKCGFLQRHPSRLKAFSIALRYVLLKLVPMSVPRALAEAVIRLSARQSDGNWVGAITTPDRILDEFFPRSWFDSVTYVPFEHLRLPTLASYDAHLTAIYGDYMTPPPPDQRALRHGTSYFK